MAARLTFAGALDGSATQQIRISIYGGCGATGSNCSGAVQTTPDWPTTFGPKSGVDLTQSLDVSAVALAGVGSSGPPAAVYRVTGGTLNVTAAGNGSGAAFEGDASNMTFVHVDIGSGGATVDPDGCMTTISSVTFSGSAAFRGKSGVLGGLDADDTTVTYLHHRYLRP